MRSIEFSLVEAAAQLLDRDEREAVMGDLIEAGEGAWRGLPGVLGLVVRRQAWLWKSLRPWLAAFGLALPCSFPLMGLSVSVTWACTHFIGGTGLWPPIRQALLLTLCAWTCGFVVGTVSRKTLWVSAAAAFFPCLFCLSRFRIESLSRLCLLLFLLPAFSGARAGLRRTQIGPALSIVLAVTVTASTLSTWSGDASWFLNCLLVWPAWYMAVTANKET